jgi:acetoin utilization protein AcuB
MSKAEPKIQKFMTYQPHSIEAAESVSEARKIMSELKIRHLPVLKNGEIFGMVSERDIRAALSLMGANPEAMKVSDICHEHPYQVEPETTLREVAETMAENHYGSAIIAQNKKLVGIFTTVDACKAISEILQQRYHPS